MTDSSSLDADVRQALLDLHAASALFAELGESARRCLSRLEAIAKDEDTDAYPIDEMTGRRMTAAYRKAVLSRCQAEAEWLCSLRTDVPSPYEVSDDSDPAAAPAANRAVK